MELIRYNETLLFFKMNVMLLFPFHYSKLLQISLFFPGVLLLKDEFTTYVPNQCVYHIKILKNKVKDEGARTSTLEQALVNQ